MKPTLTPLLALLGAASLSQAYSFTVTRYYYVDFLVDSGTTYHETNTLFATTSLSSVTPFTTLTKTSTYAPDESYPWPTPSPSSTIVMHDLMYNILPSAVPTYGADAFSREILQATFAITRVFSAPANCTSRWTATATKTFTLDMELRGAYASLATSTAQGPMEIQLASAISTDEVAGTFAWTTVAETVGPEFPWESAEPTEAPIYYVPEEYEQSGKYVWIGTDRSALRGGLWWTWEAGFMTVLEECRAPNGTRPGPDYEWKSEKQEWGLIGSEKEEAAREARKRKRIKVAWIVMTVVAGVLVLGLVQSVFSFSRLMKGEECWRGIPLLWVVLSLGLLGFLWGRARERNAADKTALKEKWQGIGLWRRFGLWLRWGLVRKYPVALLGDETSQDTERGGSGEGIRLSGSVETLPVYEEGFNGKVVEQLGDEEHSVRGNEVSGGTQGRST